MKLGLDLYILYVLHLDLVALKWKVEQTAKELVLGQLCCYFLSQIVCISTYKRTHQLKTDHNGDGAASDCWDA